MAGLAAFGSAASAAEGDGDAPSGLPQVDPFHETFDDLSSFTGDVSAFEIVGDGGN